MMMMAKIWTRGDVGIVVWGSHEHLSKEYMGCVCLMFGEGLKDDVYICV